MSNILKLYIYSVTVLITYCLIFYYIGTEQANVDFSSFYASSLALLEYANPYQVLSVSFLAHSKGLAVNLNPPFFILLFSPLTFFSYTQAALIFCIGSLLLGIIGALICFYYCVTPEYFRNKSGWFVLIYLSTYATLINTHINQIGGVLLFFIMYGYCLFLQKKEYKAGIFWGIAIAIKLFPALLFIFALSKKRYTLCFVMLSTCSFAWFIVVPFRGVEVYHFYFKTLNSLSWYGNSWNASILGFLYRLLVDTKTQANLSLTNILYLIISVGLLGWYSCKLIKLKANDDHKAFGFTLIMMVIMSPLGWNYYFGLLILPLLIVFQALIQQEHPRIKLWFICFYLLNFPLDNQPVRLAQSIFLKATIYSIYFYGLILLAYLLLYVSKMEPKPLINKTINAPYLFKLELSLGLGLFTVLLIFLRHSLFNI